MNIFRIVFGYLKKQNALGKETDALRELHFETELPEYQELREKMRKVKEDNADIGGNVLFEINEPNLNNKIKNLLKRMNGKHLTQYIDGYPLLYYDKGFEVLCAECAMEGINGEKEDNIPVNYDIFYEGESEYCVDCGKEIESAYGPVEENDT